MTCEFLLFSGVNFETSGLVIYTFSSGLVAVGMGKLRGNDSFLSLELSFGCIVVAVEGRSVSVDLLGLDSLLLFGIDPVVLFPILVVSLLVVPSCLLDVGLETDVLKNGSADSLLDDGTYTWSLEDIHPCS